MQALQNAQPYKDEAPAESHDYTEDSYKISKVDYCKFSTVKLVIFCVLSLTLIPLLVLKWFPKIRRWLLYSFTTFQEATYVYVIGLGMPFIYPPLLS